MVRALAAVADGVAHSAAGRHARARRCFAAAAGVARGAGQPLDAARALLLQAAHTEEGGARGALAAAAAAAASRAGDEVLAGLALRVAAACPAPAGASPASARPG
eukprot:tig00000754_g3888.t1